jgi:RHS repeat-associated protein
VDRQWRAREEDGHRNGDRTGYTYDSLGNLLEVALPTDTIEYLVDGMGRRVGKNVNGTVTKKWLWRSQLQPVAELDASNNVVQRYVYADGVNVPDQIITAAATYRLIKDHLGSVCLVVNEVTGAVVQRFDYDSWGRIIYQGFAPGFDAHFQPFGFAGGLYDPHTGPITFGAREYDSETGRWVSKDPLGFGGGLNLFGYADGDPVNLLDWTGAAPTRAELTSLAELMGVGSTANIINEHAPMMDSVSHGDIGGAALPRTEHRRRHLGWRDRDRDGLRWAAYGAS